MNLEFSRQIFEKYSNIKFHENPSSGSRAVTCGRTDGRSWWSWQSRFAILRKRQKCGLLLPPLVGKWEALLHLFRSLCYTQHTVLCSLMACRFISNCVCLCDWLVLWYDTVCLCVMVLVLVPTSQRSPFWGTVYTSLRSCMRKSSSTPLWLLETRIYCGSVSCQRQIREGCRGKGESVPAVPKMKVQCGMLERT
jgi:hypothetical protein